jgi:hypothetical protein
MHSPLRLGGTLASLWLVLVVGLRAELVMNDEGRYAIDMGAPQQRSQTEGTPVIYMMLHEEGDTAAYIASYNDLPPGSGAKMELIELYKDAMQANLRSTNSDVVSSGECQLGDVKGWEFTSLTKDGKLASHGRYYLVGDRFYQVVYMGRKDSENSEECRHFLDSFRLLR